MEVLFFICIFAETLKIYIMEIEYVYNWCDFFTRCPHKDCEIGSFECHQCENFISNRLISNEIENVDGYKRYLMLNKGVVTCKLNY